MQENSNTYLSAKLCAEVVRKVTMECYGVVGLASPNGVTLFSHLLPAIFNRRGIEVSVTPKGYRINVYIVAEYGTTFKAIAENLCQMIKYTLNKTYGVNTDGIRIHIKGVRISE